MLAAGLLAMILAIGSSMAPATAPSAIATVPDEAGATFLPDDEPTFQAVAADLDGDGARDVVRLVGAERGSIRAEAWTVRDGSWSPLAGAVDVIPGRPSGGQGGVVYDGAPVRLLVHHVDGADRVTVVRQPRFVGPDFASECCLLLHGLVLADGQLSLTAVAQATASVGAVSAIDFDGDGTDELLTSRSLPPLGDIGYPSELGVYRWNGRAFDAPAVTQIPIGSGDTPFVLGDSDGHQGEEAAIISTIGRPALYRLTIDEADEVHVEDAGLVATDALAVSVNGARGIAVVGPTVDLAVMTWRRDGAPEEIATLPMDDGILLGSVQISGQPHLVVRQTNPEALHLLRLPHLEPSLGNPVTRSPAAATLASTALRPYIGSMPGGGLDGEPAVVYAGRLLPSPDRADAPFRTLDTAVFASLAGAEPVGLVGPDRSWLAILHAPLPLGAIDPRGGRLDAPVFPPASGVSVAPVELSRTPETDDGSFDPELDDVVQLPGVDLGSPPTGFRVRIQAPPGSRAYVAVADPSVVGPVVVVPDGGVALVPVVPPEGVPSPAFRATITIATPAGHGYTAGWDIRVLGEPPPLQASVSTSIGSPTVDVSGQTVTYARVTVDGHSVLVGSDGQFSTRVRAPPWPTSIEVVATDPFGQAATTSVSGVGFFDYRGLPWVPIAVILVMVAGIVLFLRVPRPEPLPRRADDAVLEEMDPD
ncbi:MAG TPA: hypothetical protein VJ975_06090 [Candidatus Limnocylindria bacterium]|nr:hypothetical protein [Candidatus Limnocylindria bacterium]